MIIRSKVCLSIIIKCIDFNFYFSCLPLELTWASICLFGITIIILSFARCCPWARDFDTFLHNFNPLICVVVWLFIFRYVFISGSTHRSYRFFYLSCLLFIIIILKIIIRFNAALVVIILIIVFTKLFNDCLARRTFILLINCI